MGCDSRGVNSGNCVALLSAVHMAERPAAALMPAPSAEEAPQGDDDDCKHSLAVEEAQDLRQIVAQAAAGRGVGAHDVFRRFKSIVRCCR